jgi:NADPH2 dehydrogenase
VRLFDTLALRELTIRNRIMMSPMSQRAAGEDGRVTDWHLVHYGSRAVGGCGLVMVEDTSIAPLGRTGRSSLGLYDRAQAERLHRVVSFCRDQGAAVGVQLAHAGRKALADMRGAEGIVSASSPAFGPGWTAPREAGAADLAQIVNEFATSTDLALEAEFDVVEVHAAHGYLLHQFLSPLTNLRYDGYGGDGVSRRRLLVEVVEAVRARWPVGRPLFVRLPAGDGEPGGLGAGEVVACARACAAAGADLIDLTGGTPLFGGRRVTAEQTWTTAAALSAGAEVPVALGGGIVDGADAQALLDEHGAMLVSVGRPLLENPYWPVRAARDLDSAEPLPASYAAALRSR